MARVDKPIDLNLLTVLEVLLLERHVTRAGQTLHMSQPAVSRALATLRDHFDDPLLVRVGQSMRLTPKAEQLLPPLRAALAELRAVMVPNTFVPASATGTFRITAPDVITFMLGASLHRYLQQHAPQIVLDIAPWSHAWREPLLDGSVDLTFGEPQRDEPGLYAAVLVRNDWACVMRRGHPALRRKWSVQTYAQLDHLVIGFTADRTTDVDIALRELGLQRRIPMRVPYVLASPMLVAETDLVLTTARWLAERLAAPLGLALRAPPAELGLAPVDLPMVWHERTHRDPAQRWLRSTLARLAREAGMLSPASRTMPMLRNSNGRHPHGASRR
jgi:DNA-binding transcriptional LysR family regulator